MYQRRHPRNFRPGFIFKASASKKFLLLLPLCSIFFRSWIFLPCFDILFCVSEPRLCEQTPRGAQGGCVRARPSDNDGIWCAVSRSPPWVTEASLKALMISARMCSLISRKFLNSLFCVGTFSPGASRGRQMTGCVCRRWFCIVQKPHYFTRPFKLTAYQPPLLVPR